MSTPRQACPRFSAIEVDTDNPYGSGEFYWKVGNITTTTATQPQSKFELLVWLGLMPDTHILSNKLIKAVGSHVFRLLWKKGDYKSRFAFLEKKQQQKPMIFDAIQLKELWHCWRLIAKLRALQEMDYLFNQPFLTEQVNQDDNSAFAKTKCALQQLYPEKIGADEQHEYCSVVNSLEQLANELETLKTTAERNQCLQQWQQQTFRMMFANFQIYQGELSAEEHDILPRENWENTAVTQEAESILQNWEFGETGLIKDSMLYRHDRGDVFYSGAYAETNKQHLLYAAYLAEHFGASLSLDASDFQSAENLNSKTIELNAQHEPVEKFTLYQVRDSYEKTEAAIWDESIAMQKRQKDQANAPTLATTSKLLREWWEQWQTAAQRHEQLRIVLQKLAPDLFQATPPAATEALITSTLSEEKAIEATTFFTEAKFSSEAKESSVSLAEGVKSGLYTATAAPEKNYIFSPGDFFTASFRFLYDFSLYFDEMMSKHPFIATAFFAIPYLQFGGMALAVSGNSSILELSHLFAVLESKLLLGKVSAAQINGAVALIDQKVAWLTSAHSALQILLACGFTIAKVTYTTVDEIVNKLFSELDQTTLTELAHRLDPYGVLTGAPVAEIVKSYLLSFVNAILLLIAAGAIGVGADLTHSAFIEFFAHVPHTLITHPSIPTIGALKASALLIGKLTGIHYQIAREWLMGVDGTRITEKSPSYQVIVLFVELAIDLRQLTPQEVASAEFNQVRNHFEELLQMNPSLLAYFNDDEIKKLNTLGVRLRSSRWYHQLPVSILKSAFYALMFVPAIFAHMYYAYAQKPLPPMWKLSLAVPLNWVILAGLILWTSAKAVVHGFLQLAIRAPEVSVQAAFVVLRLGLASVHGLAILGGYGLKGFGYLLHKKWCQAPVKTSAEFFATSHQQLKNLQTKAVSWIRINLRYRCEHLIAKILKFARDYLVRKGQQWLQQAIVPNMAHPVAKKPAQQYESLHSHVKSIFENLRKNDLATPSSTTSTASPSSVKTQATHHFSVLATSVNTPTQSESPLPSTPSLH